jgi:hypothetical protein
MPIMHADVNTTALAAPLPYGYSEFQMELEVLQHAFSEVLCCSELREADPPMLDVLYSLNERFSDLLKRA